MIFFIVGNPPISINGNVKESIVIKTEKKTKKYEKITHNYNYTEADYRNSGKEIRPYMTDWTDTVEGKTYRFTYRKTEACKYLFTDCYL